MIGTEVHGLTTSHERQFHSEGFTLVCGLFSPAEAQRLCEVARTDPEIAGHSYELKDAHGNRTRLALWYTPGDDIYGRLSRCNRLVDAVECLLCGPVGHYHSKVMQKAPRTGGAWEWHQDYAYWYRNGYLFPQMLSVMVALTASTKANGCLEVIPRSHLMGRINHANVGEQVGADPERVSAMMKLYSKSYCEMQPGDALFFHCNLLHASGQNTSSEPRWSIISAYNRLSNRPINESEPRSSITPISRVDDDRLLDPAAGGVSATADFLDKSRRRYQDRKD